MQRLARSRSRRPGLADLLPWAVVAGDGLVQTKRGAFLAGYRFTPPDNASSTDEFTAYVSERCNEALLRLGTGWSSWTDAASVPAPPYPPASASAFPDPLSRAVDEERRRAYDAEGAHFENWRAFVLCYHPPHQAVGRVERLFYDDDAGAPDEAGLLARVAEGFQRTLEQFEAAIGGLIGLRRMRGYRFADTSGRIQQRDELVNWLNFCATGKLHAVNLPACGAFLDTLIGGQDLDPGDIPLIGEDWVMAVVIDGLPAESCPNILTALATLPIGYRFSQRMIYLDPHDSERMLAGYRRAWSGRVKPFFATMLGFKNPPLNEHAIGMRDDAQASLALASSGAVRFGYYTGTVILRGREMAALRQLCNQVVAVINDCGFGARIETLNTVEAWRGALPGDIHSQVRRPPMHSATLCDLLPLSGVWTGAAQAPCPKYPSGTPALMHARTIGSIPFRANLHVDDVGHTLIFGPTGAGKSALLNSIAMQARRYAGMRITGFDNKRGMLATTQACGGRYYEIGGAGSPQLCPLGWLDDERDRAHAEDWIGVCFELQQGEPPTPQQRAEIHRAILRLTDPGHRSLTDFCIAVQDKAVRAALHYYTLQGSAGWLTDGRADSLADADFTVFETLDLLSMGETTSLPVLLSLFRRFERGLDGRPSLLIIDEGWVALGNKAWAGKLFGWLKLLRSKNCAVVFATQSLSDATRSNMLDVLMENCPTKVFLPNPEAQKRGTAQQPGPRDLYEVMGLNENQIELLRTARLKRDYYWTSREGSRVIDLGLGPVQLAFAGATGEDDVTAVKRLIAAHGAEWPWRYLDSKGIGYAHLL